jgi:hypothetical protein
MVEASGCTGYAWFPPLKQPVSVSVTRIRSSTAATMAYISWHLFGVNGK